MAKKWEDEKVSITLTNAEWTKLDVFLLMTTHFREEERDTWRKLAEEKDENGDPAYPNAKGNADFWQSQIDFIAKVQTAIGAR